MTQILKTECEPLLKYYRLVANSMEDSSIAKISNCNGEIVAFVPRDISKDDLEKKLQQHYPPLKSESIGEDRLQNQETQTITLEELNKFEADYAAGKLEPGLYPVYICYIIRNAAVRNARNSLMHELNFEEPIRIDELSTPKRTVEILLEYDEYGHEWWALVENGMNVMGHEYSAHRYSLDQVKDLIKSRYSEVTET